VPEFELTAKAFANFSPDLTPKALANFSPAVGEATTLVTIAKKRKNAESVRQQPNPFRVCREKGIDSGSEISKLRAWEKPFVHMT
jgi:hypothetical protein